MIPAKPLTPEERRVFTDGAIALKKPRPIPPRDIERELREALEYIKILEKQIEAHEEGLKKIMAIQKQPMVA
jgi:hypothetical protein